MTISIPVATELLTVLDTSVIDSTYVFDNTVKRNYELGLTYQEDGKIYENVVETVYPFDYVAEATYALNDVVFKDNLVQKVVSLDTNIPKPPSEYGFQDSGFNHLLWSSRYSKIRDIPVGFVDGVNIPVRDASKYGWSVQFSANGTRMYQTDTYNNTIYQYNLSVAWDITTAVYAKVPNGGFDTTCVDFCFSADGTKLYTCNGTWKGIIQFNLGTPWEIDSIWQTYYTLNVGVTPNGVSFSADGHYIYYTRTDTQLTYQTYLTTAWTIPSVTPSPIATVQTPRFGGYNNLPMCPTFSADGTKMYSVERGYNYYYVQLLSTPWDITTITDTQRMGSVASPENIAWKPDGTKFYVMSGANDKIYQYTCETAWDALTAFNTVFPIRVFQYHDGNTYYYNIYQSGDDFLCYTYMITSEGTTAAPTETMHVYNTLTNDSLDLQAYTYTDGVFTNWVAKTMIIEPTGIYIRTTQPVDKEYIIIPDEPTFSIITSPKDIPNFALMGPTNDASPFDIKNYTYATSEFTMMYNVECAAPFDTFALGNVKGEHLYAEFRDPNGTVINTVDVDIDTSRDGHAHLDPWYTTMIHYADPETNETVMDAGSSVYIEITSTAGTIELATLMLGMSAKAGFTNLTLKNEYKDYSVYENDEWGNADYTERAKVSRYSGTVDIEISDYDMTDRLMTSLGKNLVIVNGSDGPSCGCDSMNVFAATQKIGRFMGFNQQTKIKDGDMGVLATYSFTLEEIV